MNGILNVKPIDFKFGEYLNNGFALLKKDFINIFVACICCFIMSVIPFCGFLALGNFYKYLRKLNKGQVASPGDIFNFDDFMPYFILQLILIAGIVVLYIPMIFVIPMLAMVQGEDAGVGMIVFLFVYLVLYVAALLYLSVRGFYIPALISFKGVTDIKTAWKASKVMTGNNVLNIFLFSIVVMVISYLGVIACGIGILLTLPLMYTVNYFAYEDAMQQISHDEISEIGIIEKY